MTIHKRAHLTPIQRQEIFDKYFNKGIRICDLQRQYSISRPTIYRALERDRQKDFSIHKNINKNINKRYRCLEYGLKRLAKVEAELEKKLKAQAKRYTKQYPGEMFHSDQRH